MTSFDNALNCSDQKHRTNMINLVTFDSKHPDSGYSSYPQNSNYKTVDSSSKRRNSTSHFEDKSKEFEGRICKDLSSLWSLGESNSSLDSISSSFTDSSQRRPSFDSFSYSSSSSSRRGSAFDNSGRLDWGKLVEKEFTKEIGKMDEGDVENLAYSVWQNSQTLY